MVKAFTHFNIWWYRHNKLERRVLSWSPLHHTCCDVTLLPFSLRGGRRRLMKNYLSPHLSILHFEISTVNIIFCFAYILPKFILTIPSKISIFFLSRKMSWFVFPLKERVVSQFHDVFDMFEAPASFDIPSAVISNLLIDLQWGNNFPLAWLTSSTHPPSTFCPLEPKSRNYIFTSWAFWLCQKQALWNFVLTLRNSLVK